MENTKELNNEKQFDIHAVIFQLRVLKTDFL